MYNQSDFLSNPSSSKDIGASRIKITASAAEKFEDKKSDNGESNISSESEIEDAGNNSATFVVVDRLKISSELKRAASCTDLLIAVRSACLFSTPLGLPVSCSASIYRFLLCFGFAGGFLAPDLTFPIKKSLYNITVTLNAFAGNFDCFFISTELPRERFFVFDWPAA